MRFSFIVLSAVFALSMSTIASGKGSGGGGHGGGGHAGAHGSGHGGGGHAGEAHSTPTPHTQESPHSSAPAIGYSRPSWCWWCGHGSFHCKQKNLNGAIGDKECR